MENASVGLSTRRTALLELALAHCGRDRVVDAARRAVDEVCDKVSRNDGRFLSFGPERLAHVATTGRRGRPLSVLGGCGGGDRRADAGARGVAAGRGRGRRGRGSSWAKLAFCVLMAVATRLVCDGAGTSHVTSEYRPRRV